MTDIQNLKGFDPFADEQEEGSTNLIHIRIQQRNGRKTLTTVQGIGEEFDKKRLVKAFKKQFACNGTVVDHPEYGEVIQLQGDQRNKMCEFMVMHQIADKDRLKVHGF